MKVETTDPIVAAGSLDGELQSIMKWACTKPRSTHLRTSQLRELQKRKLIVLGPCRFRTRCTVSATPFGERVGYVLMSEGTVTLAPGIPASGVEYVSQATAEAVANAVLGQPIDSASARAYANAEQFENDNEFSTAARVVLGKLSTAARIAIENACGGKRAQAKYVRNTSPSVAIELFCAGLLDRDAEPNDLAREVARLSALQDQESRRV